MSLAEQAHSRARSMYRSELRCAIERRLLDIPGTQLRFHGACVPTAAGGRTQTVDELFQ